MSIPANPIIFKNNLNYQKSQNRPGLIPDFFHFYKKDKNAS